MSGDGSLSIFKDGKGIVVSKDHSFYNNIVEALDKRPFVEQDVVDLLDFNKTVLKLSLGKVRIDFDKKKIWYDDAEFNDEAFCDRVFRLMKDGKNVEYLAKFLNNLCQNPSFRAIMETFKFIANRGMPITEDGCFLAYKGVDSDFMDKYTRTIDNTPDGRRIEIDRDKVCADPNKGCESGLHVGSLNYAVNYGRGGRVILVKINPRDVVSVPNHECEKMRICGYWTIKEYENTSTYLEGEVYDDNGNLIPISKHSFFDNLFNEHWQDLNKDENRTYCDGLSVSDKKLSCRDGLVELHEEQKEDSNFVDDYDEDDYEFEHEENYYNDMDEYDDFYYYDEDDYDPF